MIALFLDDLPARATLSSRVDQVAFLPMMRVKLGASLPKLVE